jgi:hypothetical protein
VSQVSQVAQARASGSWLEEQLLLRAPMPAGGTGESQVGPQGESQERGASPKKDKAHPPKKGEAHSPKAEAKPDVPREAKVVLCHGTHSEKKPGVTISVSEHALAGLGNDTSGACG